MEEDIDAQEGWSFVKDVLLFDYKAGRWPQILVSVQSLLLPVHVLPLYMLVLNTVKPEVDVFETLFGLCGEKITQWWKGKCI